MDCPAGVAARDVGEVLPFSLDSVSSYRCLGKSQNMEVVMRRVLTVVFALLLVLLLAACGGSGNSTEPAANASAGNSAGAAPANDPAGPSADEPATDEVAADPPAGEDAAPVEESAQEPTDEPAMTEDNTGDTAPTDSAAGDTAAAAGDGEGVYFGIDPETGLEINPEVTPRGVEFIARGEVISMNLTPQTSPEFVIRAPNGASFRMATQGLADIFLLDGSQLKPFEYKIGMEAKATVFLAADAALSDVLTSSDFTIIALPQ